MSANPTPARSTGVGFGGLLFLVFLTLKLTHVIDWSWWWVTAPLWGTFTLVIVAMVLTFVGAFIWYYILGKK